MKQQQTHHGDRRAAMLEAFDKLSDRGQHNALVSLHALARTFPARDPAKLSLVGSGGDNGSRK